MNLLEKGLREYKLLLPIIGFCATVAGCSTGREEQTVPIKARCAVHGEQMLLGPPEVITFPIIYWTTSEYKLAAKKGFPNVGKKVIIGCIRDAWPEHLPRVTTGSFI